jgi:hypothetical protein
MVPTIVGANLTEMLQPCPGKSAKVQVLVWVKSGVTAMLDTLSEAVPPFFRVTVLAALLVPLACFPKLRLIGLTLPMATGVEVAVGVAVRVAVALGVDVKVAVAVTVLVAVAVTVAVRVLVAVALDVAVLVAVAVAVPVAVAVGVAVLFAVAVAEGVVVGVGEEVPPEPNAMTLAE